MDESQELDQQLRASVEDAQDLDRTKLKEARKLRNEQKKAAKRLQKQKEREEKELMLKLQVKSKNVTLITRDLADKVVGNFTPVLSCPNACFNNSVDFPALFSKCKTQVSKVDSLLVPAMESANLSDEKKRVSKIELRDFLCAPASSKQLKPTIQTTEKYSGNPLDSDKPTRKRGKHREIPRVKKPSKLKREILQEKCEKQDGTLQICEEATEIFRVMDTDLCDNIVTEELNKLITMFVSAIVALQEKLFKRDSIKGKSKRRYIVGLHEAKKHLHLNKVKILIIALDINVKKHDGALNCAVKEIVNLAKFNNVPYLFALKRRLLGAITLKYIPVSCIAILNYEGLEDQHSNIIQLLPSLKKEKQKYHDTEEDANKEFLNKLMDAFKCND